MHLHIERSRNIHIFKDQGKNSLITVNNFTVNNFTVKVA